MNKYAIIWSGKLFSNNKDVIVLRYSKKRSLGYADGVKCSYLEGVNVLFTNKKEELYKKVIDEEKPIASDAEFKFEDGVEISVIPTKNYTCAYLFYSENDNLALTEFNRIKNRISLYEPFYSLK